ncbi:MAG TPA: helix-turn-helix domain-containing protein, partial [Candidatus Pelethocola excrementipullorum]|nr:helix-turn-helix domain-containing protein [Candidatus Pelethocola excrementipullorum]
YASIKNQLYYFNWSIDDSFSLVLIDLKDSIPIERRFLANQLENSPQLSCGVFDYEGYLVVLCHMPDKKTIQDTIYQYSIKYDFYAAISKVFNLLTDMSVYYEQTKRIITIGKNMSLENRIYFSDDYGLYSIIAKLLEQNSIFEICHEGVLRLYELDQNNGTEYVSTLLEYLNNDRNVLRTSKILYIHRNTLLHRLEKICDIVDIDNCNAETRHFVLLSILILKYCTS